MARTTIDTWNPDFLNLSPIFESIHEVSQPFTRLDNWPTLEQFAAEFKKRNILSNSKKPITPVPQGYTPEKFDDHYESRIFLKGELQTRLENWHDYFNATAWLQFPKIKSALNTLHYETSANRKPGTNRSPLENAIALFDECGAVIVADNDKYLDLIRQHQWKEVFWENKEAWGEHVQCYVFGHAMHEKALTPYIGMTTHTLLIKKPAEFLHKRYLEQLKDIDQYVSDIWTYKKINKTKDLQPFPLLGVPGWCSKEQNETFYENSDYFRARNISKS